MPEPPSHAVTPGRPGEPPSGLPPAGRPGDASRGRHGRTAVPGRAAGRELPRAAAARRRAVRLAVLPAGLVAVLAAGVVAYVMTAEGRLDASGAPAGGGAGTALWAVLVGALVLTCAVVATAAHLAGRAAGEDTRGYAVLRRAVADGRAELEALRRTLEQGHRPPVQRLPAPPEPAPHAGELELLGYELAVAQHAAEAAVTEVATLLRAGSAGSDEKVEVFVNLARRLQSLVHREIELLDELENEVEDPDLLKGLFHVDHLATRIRRHAENLAVLGGAVSRRQWTRPVTMTEVLRSSIAEVEQYPRVKLVPPIEGTLRGHAVADVIHLLAELVENATVFSAPQTQVLLRAQYVTSGLAVEVEDRGLGMTTAEQERMNAVLADPERIDVGELLRDGRIGLFVVSVIAQRHRIAVQLRSNIYGGVQAVLVLPRELLGDAADEPVRQDGSLAVPAAPPAPVSPAPAAAAPPAAAPEPAEARHLAAAVPPAPAPPPPPVAAPAVEPPAVEPPAPAAAAPLPAPVFPPAPARTGRHAADGVHPPAERPRPHPGQPLPEPAPGAPAVPAPAPAPQPYAPAPAARAPHGERPELPRRRRQEHLVPQLREAPPEPPGADAEPETWQEDHGHDPGLMAAFRRGTSLAEAADADDTHRPAQ